MNSMLRNLVVFLTAFTLVVSYLNEYVRAEEDIGKTLQSMTRKISDLEVEVRILKSWQSRVSSTIAFSVIALCGTFCAIWAQNTRRNAILWFISGASLNILALPFVLYFNWRDRSLQPTSPKEQC